MRGIWYCLMPTRYTLYLLTVNHDLVSVSPRPSTTDACRYRRCILIPKYCTAMSLPSGTQNTAVRRPRRGVTDEAM
ncbi:hypothetical protein EVAR_96527_1 [Eumeta japonica]|uniref:Uncharacterized protein n=1 Tax=Eumeta variegata TaxID=151549 RepID=A0A4C1WEB8_EUMVA|nr:hypothetical protein EVAR_96527_1 [Eumeta japonica]